MITNEYRISKNHEYNTRQLKEIAVQQREELKEKDRGNRARKSGCDKKISEDFTCSEFLKFKKSD